MTGTGHGRDREGPAAAARATDSVGGYLARQRRLRGISIDDLCERTKIPRRNLERLEAGAFDEQRDGFARGFVRTVAAALGLDADEAVMRLMREPDGAEEDAGGADVRHLLERFAVAAGLLLVVLALWGAVVAVRAALGGDGAPERTGLVYRPDVVRQLAEEDLAAPARDPGEAPVQGPARAPAPDGAVGPAAEAFAEPAPPAP